MNRHVRHVLIAALSIAVMFGSASSSAGVIGKAEKVAVTATLGFAAYVALYKSRCVAGGGSFDIDGGYTPLGARPIADAFTLVCPTDILRPPAFHYTALAMALPGDLAIFKGTEKLRAKMKAAGKGTNPRGCAAHHIVPEEDAKGTPDSPSPADDARDILRRCNIDINDADNGVFLPNKKDPSEFSCKGANHNVLHNKRNKSSYYRVVQMTLRQALQDDGCPGVRDALKSLGAELTEAPAEVDWAAKLGDSQEVPFDGPEPSTEQWTPPNMDGAVKPMLPPGGLQ